MHPAVHAVDIDPSSAVPSAEFLARIPHDYARRHLILSAGRSEADGGAELLLVAPSTRGTAVFNTGVALGRPTSATVVPTRVGWVGGVGGGGEALAIAIDACYRRAGMDGAGPNSDPDAPGVAVEGSLDLEADLAAAVRESERDVLNTDGKAPAVRLVDLLLFEAITRAASDVHVQPLRDTTLIRYRLDGALHTVRRLPAGLAASVISRVKVMANLDLAEHRAPQDGRATINVGGVGREGGVGGARKDTSGRRVDLRVSTLPSTYGERVVIRLLDPSKSPHLLSFEALGMPEEVRKRYQSQVCRTSGIVLSTGPTGSGKTTTLYTTLAWITGSHAGELSRGCELNILTIEDPVEYDLSSGGGLRSTRAEFTGGTDPDDPQQRTATGMGIGSGCVDGRGGRGGVGGWGGGGVGGGLTISQTQVDPRKNMTFVTGLRHILRQDPDVIMVGEIRDQETARMAVQAALTGHLVLSTLHTNDAASAVARLIDLGVEPFLVASALSAVLAQRLVRVVHAGCGGRGCPNCLGTGFKGRLGIFELLVVDAALRELINRNRSAPDLKAAAVAGGMVTLHRAGQGLVRRGITTAEELSRVIESSDESAWSEEAIVT